MCSSIDMLDLQQNIRWFMNIYEIVHHSHLFKQIGAQELPQLLGCLKSRTSNFPKDYTIIDEGDFTDEMGIVLQGSVNIVRHDFWGNRTVVTNIGVGDTFAETVAFTQSPSEVAAITSQPTTILFLNINKIVTTCSMNCVYHHMLIENLVRLLSHKNLELMKKINHITKRNTREKLLSYLSAESKRQGNKKTFTIPFDRQHLADYLCVERSAMSSELSRMRSEGLVDYHKSTFTLLEEN